MKESYMKILKRYGIHNEKELEEAYRKQEKLDVGIFTKRSMEDVLHHNTDMRQKRAGVGGGLGQVSDI